MKLGEIESQLQRGHTTAERYSYLASVVVDTSTPAVHSGQSLMAKIGGSSTPAAQGVQSAVLLLSSLVCPRPHRAKALSDDARLTYSYSYSTAFLVRSLQEGHGCITSKMIKYSY